jgi:hypothetical protein
MEQFQQPSSSNVENTLAQNLALKITTALERATTKEDIDFILNLAEDFQNLPSLVQKEIDNTKKKLASFDAEKDTIGEIAYAVRSAPYESKLALLEQTLGALLGVTKH